MATIDRQNTTGTLSTLYGQSNLQWYFFSIHNVINLRNYWTFHDDVHIVTVPFSSRIRSRTAQRKKLFKCLGDQLKPFLVRVAALKPALSQVDSPFLLHQISKFIVSHFELPRKYCWQRRLESMAELMRQQTLNSCRSAILVRLAKQNILGEARIDKETIVSLMF